MIKLIHGDCITYMQTMDPVDVVISDIPYGKLKGATTIGGSGTIGGHTTEVKPTIYNCDWDIPVKPAHFELMFKKSHHQVLFGYNYYAHILPPTNGLIVWDKKKKNNWFDTFSDGELIWTSYQRPLRIFRYLWMGAVREGPRIKRVHPAQKPLALMEWIVAHYSEPGDVVLDPYMGSGTTGEACLNLGRDFIGIEQEQRYFEYAEERCT